jgi:hypothetical protein
VTMIIFGEIDVLTCILCGGVCRLRISNVLRLMVLLFIQWLQFTWDVAMLFTETVKKKKVLSS